MVKKMASLLTAALLVVTAPPFVMAQEQPNPAPVPGSEAPAPAPVPQTEPPEEQPAAPANQPPAESAPPGPLPAPEQPQPPVCGPNAADHLVISEYGYDIAFDANSWDPSYVELYNPTNETIDLAPYALRETLTGVLWESIDLQGSVKPCSYFLIGLRFYDKVRELNKTSVPFPAADLTTDLFISNSGTIALTKDIPAAQPWNPENGPAPVDMLGLSDAAYREGDHFYFFTDAAGNKVDQHGKALTRTDSKVDTNNNAADFSAQPVSPTNQLSVAGGVSRQSGNLAKTTATPSKPAPAPESVSSQVPAPANPEPNSAPELEPAAQQKDNAPQAGDADGSTATKGFQGEERAGAPTTSRPADPEAEAVASAVLAMSKGVTQAGNNLGKGAKRVVILRVPSGPLELGEGMPTHI